MLQRGAAVGFKTLRGLLEVSKELTNGQLEFIRNVFGRKSRNRFTYGELGWLADSLYGIVVYAVLYPEGGYGC